MHRRLMKRVSRRGFSIIELLVIVVILAMLMTLGMMGAQRYITRAHDAERKSDLQRYRIAFEDYFSDNGRYPAVSVLQDCGGQGLQPYLNEIACDPGSGDPYHYQVDASMVHFALYADLVHDDDPSVQERFCQTGCGPDLDGDNESDFNYGITDAGPVTGTGSSEENQCSYSGTSSPTCFNSEGTAFCFAGSTNCCGGSICATNGQICYSQLVCEDN